MNGAERLLHTLVSGGVEVCFANPGTSEMQFVAALDHVPRMRAVLTLFEGVATGAADGYGRMADKPAATLLHLGPGLANGIANLHNARRARSPVVNIVGDHATYHRAHDAPLTSDIDSLARPCSAWVRTVEDAGEIGAAAAEAISAAAQPPGHVATLIVPADCSWSAAGEAAVPPPRSARPKVGDDAVREAAQALRRGNALMLMNGQALREESLALASRIAARCGARVMTDTFFPRLQRGAGRAPVERLPYFGEQAMQVLDGVRRLILVGTRPPVSFFAYPGLPGVLTPPNAEVLLLASPGDDAPDALHRLAEAVGAGTEPARLCSLERPPLPEGEFSPRAIGLSIAAQMPDEVIVSDEGGTCGLHVFAATAHAPRHDWLPLTGGSIGQGLPLAAGCAIACPDRKILALQADGSGMYTLQALWTQAREQLDVTTVIFANRQYRILQHELKRVGADPAGSKAMRLLDIGSPDLDWVQLAQGMGVSATRATSIDAFNRQFAAAMAERGPSLIEAVL